MPMYRMVCPKCGTRTLRLATITDYKAGLKCPEDAARLEREFQPPSTVSVETLDNGVMARKVVRPVNAEELHRDRATADTIKKKGGQPRPL